MPKPCPVATIVPNLKVPRARKITNASSASRASKASVACRRHRNAKTPPRLMAIPSHRSAPWMRTMTSPVNVPAPTASRKNSWTDAFIAPSPKEKLARLITNAKRASIASKTARLVVSLLRPRLKVAPSGARGTARGMPTAFVKTLATPIKRLGPFLTVRNATTVPIKQTAL